MSHNGSTDPPGFPSTAASEASPTRGGRAGSWAWLLMWLACAVVVACCYWFVDRPLVELAHANDWRSVRVLHWLQPIPKVVLWLALPAGLYLGWRLFRRSVGRFERFLLHALPALALSVVLKYPVKFLFGRTFPSTFKDDNPSLIAHGVYGFNPFHGGIAYEAFPSGHTAAIFALAAVIWLHSPRWRWLGITLALASSVGVLGLYYHFLGDVIAGACFGVALGAGVVHHLPPSRISPDSA